MHEVIVISDDESKNGTIADCPIEMPASPRHRAPPTPGSSTCRLDMRGNWPFKRKTIVHQGESSRGKQLKMPPR